MTASQSPSIAQNGTADSSLDPFRPSDACRSLLDNDLYKLTMQQAVRQHYPNTPVSYTLTNRSPEIARIPPSALPWLTARLYQLGEVRLTQEERHFLERKCPYLTKDYLDWLQHEFRFRPASQIHIEYRPLASFSATPSRETTASASKIGGNGRSTTTTATTTTMTTPEEGKRVQAQAVVEHLSITVSGLWDEVILYEIPILALVSEAFFRFGDTDWDYAGQFEGARDKARQLVQGGARFAEFGTRRRRDYETQRVVMEGLIAGAKEGAEALAANGSSTTTTTSSSSSSPSTTTTTAANTTQPASNHHHTRGSKKAGALLGTSNLHFAHLYDLVPIGTLAHEWVMGTAAILGDAGEANLVALHKWNETYPSHLHIALTDTFTTKVFLANAWDPVAKHWDGVRHDSGDPFEFADQMSALFARAVQEERSEAKLPRTRAIVFSDGLSTKRALALQQHMDNKQQPYQATTFGIGTHFTNDFQRLSKPEEPSPAMNIVVKLKTCRGRVCVKLSDDQGKESGTSEAVERVRCQIAKYAV
ncbi:nicotinate phosphoribosyltransferase [Actinomortierella ambigua]|nr:nicotinate phosphoribosyltransferase [Actinomortierella ambigua]